MMRKPILIDLDGVLRLGNKPADDIVPFLTYLEQDNIPGCIISNSSLYSSEQISDFFNQNSIEVNFPIITAVDAAFNYISAKYTKVAAYTSENVIGKFADFLEYEKPEAVLIGDIGEVWNYKLMQTIFEYIRNDAELIAIHKNKFWNKNNSKLQLDAGPFIHAIEYATESKATLIGKPSPLYFHTALHSINFGKNDSFIMLGDDLDTDMKGANQIGGKTILIYTGKTNPKISREKHNYVDFEATNLTEVIEILKLIEN